MDPIWSQLPNDLALKIIGLLDDIDTRLEFRIPPRRLRFNKNFEFRNEIVYDMANKILFQNGNRKFFVRKNINLSSVRQGPLYVFNMEWEPYDLTIYVDHHAFGPIECSTHLVTNKRVKFILKYGPRDMGQFTNRIGA
jgi:hypothetical protein